MQLYKMASVKITSVLKQLKPNLKNISFELNNNKTLNLEEVIKFSPLFCSVTWLDNNLSNLEAHPTITLSKNLIDSNLNVILHLPGKIFDTSTFRRVLDIIKGIGVRNILALQGEYSLWKNASKEDFPYAKDVVKFIKENYGDYFCVGITGYPEGHPRSGTLEVDTNYLKQKVLAGADFIITQAIFDIESLRNFYKRCRENDIHLPIIPGIFVIDSRQSLLHMVKLCKLVIPDGIKMFLDDHNGNKDVIKKFGIERTIEIVNALLSDPSIPTHCVHIFTMNKIKNVEEVWGKLNNV